MNIISHKPICMTLSHELTTGCGLYNYQIDSSETVMALIEAVSTMGPVKEYDHDNHIIYLDDGHSGKRQAASGKRQAASGKRQAPTTILSILMTCLPPYYLS